MAVVKCKIEWESDEWSYIELQGSQPRYTKVPSSIIVNKNDESHISVEKIIKNKRTWASQLKDVRYPEYDFISFNIKKDQFVEDDELESECKKLYKEWCKKVYYDKLEELEKW